MDAQGFVFLSHNSADKRVVEEIAKRLRAEGIEPWLDAWHLVPGEKWQPAVEKALVDARASVVFIGPSGLGPWQDEEMRVAIDRRVGDSGYRVVPVLLPGAERGKRSAVPPFLANVTWVEFQRSLDEEAAFRRLLAGIEGKPPGPPVESPVSGTNPYRGLQLFDVADSGLFFGRDALVGWLLSDLRASLGKRGDARLLAIVGASGGGKSSLARAGLLAQLQAGAIEGSWRWRYVIFKPGTDPLESLARAGTQALGLSDVKAVLRFQDDLLGDARILHTQAALALQGAEAGARLVILVDQFEELFTLCTNEVHWSAFIDNLLRAASVVDGPAVVVVTLRADFLGKCVAYSELAAMLADHQELVGPLGRGEMREAIERPAWQSGTEFQPGLVETLLDDVEAQPGPLPLLQHALRELWSAREGRKLTHEAYERIGRVQGALARRADELYGSFTPKEQTIARRILLRLTQPGEGTEDTRRRALLSEIVPSAEAQSNVEDVVRKLADERLLVTEQDTVDVAHEALIRGWPRLREWLDQNREGLREHRRLTVAAKEWNSLDQDPSALYRGLKLDQALVWREKNDEELSELERRFLGSSARLREDEQQRERTQALKEEALRREAEEARFQRLKAAKEHAEQEKASAFKAAASIRRRSRLAAAAGLFASALGIGALILWGQARHAFVQARAGELAAIAETLAKDYPDRSMLLALEAWKMAPVPKASALIRASDGAYPYRTLRGHWGVVLSAQFSRDGTTVVTASGDDTARLWDAASGRELHVLRGHTDRVVSAQFSANGKTVLTVGGGREFIAPFKTKRADKTARLWDVASGKEARILSGHDVEDARFSPDDKAVLTTSWDNTARLWDVASGRELRTLRGHEASVASGQFSADGKMVLTTSGDKTARLWDVASGRELRTLRGATRPVSPAGSFPSTARWC